MRLRAHTLAPNGRCLWCGAKAGLGNDAEFGDRSCIERDDHAPATAPEPRRRELAHEDAAAIGARLVELQAEREHAWVVGHCAAKAGRPKTECHQCGPGERCKACVSGRLAFSQCPICWKDTTRPCPS